MPGVMPKLVIPTGYEDEQVKAERKRRMAEMLYKQGLNNQNISSWTQVLGDLAQTYAGKRNEDKADKLDQQYRHELLDAYTAARTGLEADRKSGTAPADLVAKYGGNPLLADDPTLKAETGAFEADLKPTNFGGRMVRTGDVMNQYEPSKPTDSVIRNPDGSWKENPVVTSSALHRQGYGMGDPVAQMPDPYAKVAGAMVPQVMPPQGAPMSPPPMPAAQPNPEAGVDLSVLSPEEKQILQNEIMRRKNGGGAGGAYQPPNPNTPMGNPLTAQRAPAGVVNGKPYWLINGMPYDNPEGK
jgi:hypothetical protein